jgi:ABC-type Co2+ transport system permease subunit
MTDAESPTPSHSDDDYAPNALPSTGARVLAFVSILLAGTCGGIIGYAFADLQCTGDCSLQRGLGALIGALVGAVGVAVVATLALRAMGEWRVIQHRDQEGT